MKLIAALAAVTLQALAILPRVTGTGLLVEFNQDLVFGGRLALSLQASDDISGDATNTTVDSTPAGGDVTDDTEDADDTDDTEVFDDTDDIVLTDGPIISEVDPGFVVQPIISESLLAVTTGAKNFVPPSPWTFLANGAEQLDHRALTADSSSSSTSCADSSQVNSNGEVRVLVAVSSCFNNRGWTLINAWITKLKKQELRYLDGNHVKKIKFRVRTVADGCSKPTKAKEDFNANQNTNYAAVLSIMVYSQGYTTIQNYVNTRNPKPTLIGFAYKDATSAPNAFINPGCSAGTLPGYTIVYSSTGFLNVQNPFTVAREFYCSSLPGGYPTSYVDGNGERKCFCSCPSGFRRTNNQCEAVPPEVCECAWKNANPDYKFEVKLGEDAKYKSGSTCSIKNLALNSAGNVLPVPIAQDNYVDLARVNTGDPASGGVVATSSTSPNIKLETARVSVSVRQGSAAQPAADTTNTAATENAFTWKNFQSDSRGKINNIELTSVGRYDITLTARDYSSDIATCAGCLVVVDSRRPTSTSTCPSCNSETKKLSRNNLNDAQAGLNAVKAYKDNTANDPCSPNVRCDVDSLKTKSFNQAAYGDPVPSIETVGTFFSDDNVYNDLKLRLGGTPFDSTKVRGIANTVADSCSRCAKAETQLKEWWTPYTCASTSATSQCSGYDTAKCDNEQCITVDGKTLVDTEAALADGVKAASRVVVKAKPGNENKGNSVLNALYDLDSKIHIALNCSKFAGTSLLADNADEQISAETCSYKKKVSELITTSTKWTNAGEILFTSDDAKDFVGWRYKVGNGPWKLWKSSDEQEEVFTQPKTEITIETWTQCGKVETYCFEVVLHLNSEVEVCDYFDDMWYQRTVAPQIADTSPDQICLYKNSDFAELTFDYHPNIGLNYDVDKFEMSISAVECTLKYDDATDQSPATIVTVTSSSSPAPKSYQIVKEFAISGVDAPTKPRTDIDVSCTFTYTRKPDSSTVVHKCDRTFAIVDCDPPTIKKPCEWTGKCDKNQCSRQGSGGQDIYQACDGNRVTLSGGKTTLTTTDSSCCASCTANSGYQTQCRVIGDFPSSFSSSFKYIKRCEAVATQSSSNNFLISSPSMLEANEVTGQGFPGSSVAFLLGVSAMVAVVALVVVRRRRAVHNKPVAEEDAYYPLMG